MTTTWAIGIAAFVLAAAVQNAAVPQAPAEPLRSTLSGVYTSAQADKGKSGFLNLCVSCHNVASQSGAPWALRWGGHPLYDLYGVIRETMPVEEPQSYSPILKAQIVAYLLRLNGMPAGPNDLPTDVETLKKIRIEIPSLTER